MTGRWLEPRCCTVIGAAHRRRGQPCQDASLCASLQSADGLPVGLMAVADDLAQFVVDATTEYGLDPARVHALGYSNGANVAVGMLFRHPEVLAGALTHIAHKHVSLGIRAEHYPLVGQQLLGAMGDVLGEAFWLGGKRSKIVVTNIHPALEMSATMNLLDLTLMEKQVVGSLFGSGNPRYDIPKLLGLYREGQLDLDGLVTKEYPLEGINDGYEDMRGGRNIRGVLKY